MKTCSLCKEIKLKEFFGRHEQHSDGLSSQCKECRNKRNKEYKKKSKKIKNIS